MKKNGFTLAEVLITMGIIGVVAALTAPALIQDVSNARIAPTLSKIKSTLENANRAIMQDNNSVDLEAVVRSEFDINNPDVGNYDNYVNLLTERIAGSRRLSDTDNNNVGYGENGVTNFDGNNASGFLDNAPKLRFSSFLLTFVRPTDLNHGGISNWVQNQQSGYRGPFAAVYVDIDGENSGQNSAGFDIFGFIIDRNGGLIPMGSVAYATYPTGQFDNNIYWLTTCNENNVANGYGCAGSVFENNMKVIYK